MAVLSLLFFLAVIPNIIGLAGAKKIAFTGRKKWLVALPLGFFLELAIFELLAFSWSLCNFSFSSLCITYIAVLCVCSIFLFFYCKNEYKEIAIPALTYLECIYGIVAILLICWQISNVIHLDIGYWSSDDASYGAVANDAIRTNMLFRNNAYTGVANTFNALRAMQASLVFPAFLSFVSGMSVASILHTVLSVYYLILAYVVYFFLGKVLFKSIENSFVLLIILSVLYIFGNYTVYSQTFRLLGPNTQGKAVLAVGLIPFFYALTIEKIHQKYDKAFGLLLLLLSVTATSLSLFGAVAIMGNIIITVIISVTWKRKNIQNLRYILWGSAFPILCCGAFLYIKLVQ